jgi:hypothetical protein
MVVLNDLPYRRQNRSDPGPIAAAIGPNRFKLSNGRFSALSFMEDLL